MKLRFYCDNKDCAKEKSKPYEYEIPIEAAMEENDIAHIFCPRCKHVLKRVQSIEEKTLHQPTEDV
ncbi:MAG: hypothetical protein L6406_07440 [Desulfobacterales bacterium]|nr:hypothetical protein [Desulfobacterales bacterium]